MRSPSWMYKSLHLVSVDTHNLTGSSIVYGDVSCFTDGMNPNPFFYSAGEDGVNTTIFYGVEPLFEFPFSNESLYECLLELVVFPFRRRVIDFFPLTVQIVISSPATIPEPVKAFILRMCVSYRISIFR